MKTVNLDFLIQIKEQSKKTLNENLNQLFKFDEPILLYDVVEGSRMWPLDKEGGDPKDNASYMFYKIHEGLKNHKHDIWFLCSYLNIKKRYEKFCILTDNEKKFNLLCFPFSIKTGFSYWTDNDIRKLNKIPNKWNFCQLTSNPQTVRVATIDRFHKNKNFQYSYIPQFHFEKNEIIYHRMYYEEENEPKWWNHLIKFKNGFKLNSTKILTEIDLKYRLVDMNIDLVHNPEHTFVNDIRLDKKVFNHTLPIENHESCCDVVIETYCAGPTFFTEKTWKEIFFERPFILMGGKGYNKALQNLGFEIFEEIFDYSFDHESHTYTRMELFWEQIERYVNLNVKDFESKLIIINEKLKYNRKLYIDYMKNFNSIFKIFEQDNSHIDNSYLMYPHQNDHLFNDILDNQFNTLKKACTGFFDV